MIVLVFKGNPVNKANMLDFTREIMTLRDKTFILSIYDCNLEPKIEFQKSEIKKSANLITVVRSNVQA